MTTAIEYVGTDEATGADVVRVGDDYVVLDDVQLDGREERWQLLIKTLRQMQVEQRERAAKRQARRARPWQPGDVGRPPGWGLQDDDLTTTIEALRKKGVKPTRQVLADELGWTKDTIKRACRRAGLHGRL